MENSAVTQAAEGLWTLKTRIVHNDNIESVFKPI